jgi:PHS family inorganic phosphate transporter-like MFS transporter
MLVDWGGEPKSNHFMGPTLIILAGLCFLGLLFTFLLPETMGKSLEELGGEEEE